MVLPQVLHGGNVAENKKAKKAWDEVVDDQWEESLDLYY